MKKLALSIGAAALLATGFTLSALSAKGSNQRMREVVVLAGSQNGQGGANVYIYSASSGAPKIDPNAELGEVLAVLSTAGFDCRQGQGLTFYCVK